MVKGKVYIVGAGPGDPELITLKAVRILRMAQVVLYDRLIPMEVLDYAPGSAEKIFVGKRCGRHPIPQERINAIMVEKALEGKVVVRLKGGDPAIFGRLAEEIKALREHGIPFEIVPGVTAASAAAASLGISLTHRDCASVVSFITGHRKGGQPLDLPFEHLAALGGTIVVYMGLSTAPEIARKLIDAGMPSDTPVAVVSSAATAEERKMFLSLGQVMGEILSHFSPPSVIFIGPSVKNCSGGDV